MLVAAIADGDEWAMADLYQTYADGVRRLARSLTSASAADADDVVQETFAKVWGSAKAFDPQRGTEATFVFTIARRVIIDRWRKATRRPVTAAMDQLRHAPDQRSEAEFDRLGAAEVVRCAIAALSPLHREVIELSYWYDLSQPEIAERVGVPLGTVKSRVFHALRELHKHLPAAATSPESSNPPA